MYGFSKKPVTLADMLKEKLKKRKPRTLKRLSALIHESFAVNNGVVSSKLSIKKFESFSMTDEQKLELLKMKARRESTDLSDTKIESANVSESEYIEEV